MYYHTAVLHLFRPFLKVDLLDSNISPRGICTQSAESVASLVALYRKYYGLRRVCVIVAHVILASCTVHLLNLPSPSATHSLAEGIRALKEMSVSSGFAGRCLRIVVALSKKWGISLPPEVQEATAAVSPESMIPSPINEQFFTPLRMHHTPRSDYQRRYSATETVMPVASVTTNTSIGTSAPSAPAGNATDLFWTPFPDDSMPLQINPQTRPMDIGAMIDGNGDDWAQFGFKLSNLNDPVLGQPIFYDDWANQGS